MTEITKDKTFLKMSKKILPLIKKEKFKEWQIELEKEITYSFLFNNVYTVENNSKTDIPKIKLVDLGAFHDIKGYSIVEDFMATFTGDKKWNDDYGFPTYYTSMKQSWVHQLLEELDERLTEEGIKDEVTDIEDEDFRKLFIDITEGFWDKFVQKDLKKVIEDNIKSVREEDKQISMEVDMSMQEEAHRFELFKPIALDWLEFLEKSGNIRISMRDDIKPLKVKDVEQLKYLQLWAKEKNYDDLVLFNEFYPMSSKLDKFKWLNKSVYKEKLKERNKIKQSINNLFRNESLAVTANMISPNIRKLYVLRDEIFVIPGAKVVIIHDTHGTYHFYLDEYNRVNANADGIDDFMSVLQNSLEEMGSLIVKQITNETYIPQKPVSKEKSKIQNYYNIYGAILYQGAYRGLPSEEMHDVYTRNSETGEYIGEQEGIYFMDWDIGDSKKQP